jgi:hypothetical protein
MEAAPAVAAAAPADGGGGGAATSCAPTRMATSRTRSRHCHRPWACFPAPPTQMDAPWHGNSIPLLPSHNLPFSPCRFELQRSPMVAGWEGNHVERSFCKKALTDLNRFGPDLTNLTSAFNRG